MSRNYSNSSLTQYKQCPLSFFFKYEMGLEKVDEEKNEHHLVYGKAGHEALKGLYLGGSLEEAKETFKKAYPKQLDEEDHAKTQANGMLILEVYVKKYLKEDLSRYKVLQVEEKERFEYGGEEQFTVVLDLVMENKEFGGVYGFDHKFVGGKKATLSYEFWNQFEPNSQVTKYVSYIKSKYGDCSGFYINAIGMGHRQRMYKGEPAGFWMRFERQMFNRNQGQLDLEERDSREWIRRVEESREKNLWPMNTEGCRWCTFRPICSVGWTWEQDQENITIQYRQTPRASETKEIK